MLFAGRGLLRGCMETRTVGTLPSRLTTRRSRARQGAGPSQGFFRPRKRLTQENYETKPIWNINQTMSIT